MGMGYNNEIWVLRSVLGEVGLDMVGGGGCVLVVFWLWVIRLSRLVCGLEKKIGNICKIGVCIKFKTHYIFLCFKFVYKNNIIYTDKILNKIKN